MDVWTIIALFGGWLGLVLFILLLQFFRSINEASVANQKLKDSQKKASSFYDYEKNYPEDFDDCNS